jgi:hypothetical protein
MERFGRSKFGFGGVDPRLLFIPSCPSYTGLTGALDRFDRCESLVGFASGELLDSCVFGLPFTAPPLVARIGPSIGIRAGCGFLSL